MNIAEDFIYVRAQPEHIEQIYDIECLSFSDPWSKESIGREFSDGLARYFVAIQLSAEGRETGFIAGYCGYWSIVGEAHITNVAVRPDYRNRGVGGGLIHAMLGDIAIAGHESATLEVRVNNAGAIRLYEKFGFKQSGVRRNYYDHPKCDALIMWKKII